MEQVQGDSDSSPLDGVMSVGHVSAALFAGAVGDHASAQVEVNVHGLTDAAVLKVLSTLLAEVQGLRRQIEILGGEGRGSADGLGRSRRDRGYVHSGTESVHVSRT
jgi:hypothetical protein